MGPVSPPPLLWGHDQLPLREVSALQSWGAGVPAWVNALESKHEESNACPRAEHTGELHWGVPQNWSDPEGGPGTLQFLGPGTMLLQCFALPCKEPSRAASLSCSYWMLNSLLSVAPVVGKQGLSFPALFNFVVKLHWAAQLIEEQPTCWDFFKWFWQVHFV